MDLTKRILLLVWIAMVLPVLAADPNLLFEQGNQLYQKGEYQQAIEKYQQILKQGYESGELYFNLGNAYYRLNRLGAARLNYERAKKFLKNDEALNKNLSLLKLRLVDKIQSPPHFILSVWWQAVLDVFNLSLITWLTAGLFVFLLFSTALYLYHKRRQRSERFKSLMITGLVLFVIAAFIFSQKIYRAESEQFGVIMNPTVTLYAEPNTGGTEVFVLHEGTRVKIQRRTGDWYEIRLEDGKTGWMQKKYLEII